MYGQKLQVKRIRSFRWLYGFTAAATAKDGDRNRSLTARSGETKTSCWFQSTIVSAFSDFWRIRNFQRKVPITFQGTMASLTRSNPSNGLRRILRNSAVT